MGRDSPPGGFQIEFAAAPGWAGAEDKGTQVAIDTRITDELKLEGLARETIRQAKAGEQGVKDLKSILVLLERSEC